MIRRQPDIIDPCCHMLPERWRRVGRSRARVARPWPGRQAGPVLRARSACVSVCHPRAPAPFLLFLLFIVVCGNPCGNPCGSVCGSVCGRWAWNADCSRGSGVRLGVRSGVLLGVRSDVSRIGRAAGRTGSAGARQGLGSRAARGQSGRLAAGGGSGAGAKRLDAAGVRRAGGGS